MDDDGHVEFGAPEGLGGAGVCEGHAVGDGAAGDHRRRGGLGKGGFDGGDVDGFRPRPEVFSLSLPEATPW